MPPLAAVGMFTPHETSLVLHVGSAASPSQIISPDNPESSVVELSSVTGKLSSPDDSSALGVV